MYKEAVKLYPYFFYRVPDRFLTVEMCQNVVKDDYWRITKVPDWLKTTEMRNEAVKDEASFLRSVSDRLKTQEMCNEAVRREPYTLRYVPDHFKRQKMCEKTVEKDPWSLKYVPGWFLTHQKILRVMKLIIGRRCMFPHNYDRLIKWYDSYKKRKAQKAQIKEELMPIAWHPSRLWYVRGQKKRDRKIVFDCLICVLSIRSSKNFSRNI